MLLFFSAFGEFKDALYFHYVNGRDLINTKRYEIKVWKDNYRLFGSNGPSTNAIKLNNYGSSDGGQWKSYVFLAGKPDPLAFAPTDNLNQYSFYIPGL